VNFFCWDFSSCEQLLSQLYLHQRHLWLAPELHNVNKLALRKKLLFSLTFSAAWMLKNTTEAILEFVCLSVCLSSIYLLLLSCFRRWFLCDKNSVSIELGATYGSSGCSETMLKRTTFIFTTISEKNNYSLKKNHYSYLPIPLLCLFHDQATIQAGRFCASIKLILKLYIILKITETQSMSLLYSTQ